MPIIEVEESDYKTTLAAKNLVDKLYGSPKTRSRVLEMIKELHPDAPIPELDVAAPIKSELEAFKKEIGNTVGEIRDALQSSQRKQEVEGLIEGERRKLRKAGWDDEGIQKIEQTMQERGVVDYELAAAYVERQLKKPEPIDDGFAMDNSWNLATPADADATHKGWLTDPAAQSRKEISKFFAEKRAGRF